MWYLLQITIIVLVVHFYIGLNTHQPLFDIVLLAVFASYIVTWVISTCFDLLALALSFIKHGYQRICSWPGQQCRHHPRVHITHDPLHRD